MKKRLWFTLALAAGLVLGFGSIALAQSPEDPPSAEATAVAVEAPAPMYGMQAWVDAETGELRGPTAKEAAQMAARWQQMFGKAKVFTPKVVTYKNGMMAIELDPSIMKYSVARIDADGNLEAGCVQGTDQALELVETAASQSGPEEE